MPGDGMLYVFDTQAAAEAAVDAMRHDSTELIPGTGKALEDVLGQQPGIRVIYIDGDALAQVVP